jgi:hypothetical protein
MRWLAVAVLLLSSSLAAEEATACDAEGLPEAALGTDTFEAMIEWIRNNGGIPPSHMRTKKCSRHAQAEFTFKEFHNVNPQAWSTSECTSRIMMG